MASDRHHRRFVGVQVFTERRGGMTCPYVAAIYEHTNIGGETWTTSRVLYEHEQSGATLVAMRALMAAYDATWPTLRSALEASDAE